MKKKLLVYLLTITMVFAMAPSMSFASSNSIASDSMVPHKVKAVSYGKSAIKLTWQAPRGSEGVRVYQKIGSKYKAIKKSTTKKTHYIKKLKLNKVYKFKLKSKMSIGSKMIWSDYSSVVSATAGTSKKLKNVKTVTLDKASSDAVVGKALQLTASVSPTKKVVSTKVRWLSTDPGIANVDKNGMVMPLAPGECSIIAYSHNGVAALCTLTVYESEKTQAALKAYFDKIDINYTRDLMDKLIACQTNEEFGFRTSGSTAELAAANLLEKEMKSIGLTNVSKDPVTVDTFQFNNADLTYTDGTKEVNMEMAMYQSTYQATAEENELVYVGEGTADDYTGIDVTDKIVLIDINQYDNWWINWPAYQAKAKGAKAVISCNTGGYATYDENTVGVQDYCGPSTVPVFSISQKQTKALKAAIKANSGKLNVKINADAKVEHDKTAYNVYGEIRGKTDETIYVFGHYDAYFRAFADNTSGIGCVMGIAKALKDSGYTPNRTIKFIGHCSEEWGVDDSRYDWATGAEKEMKKYGAAWMPNAFMAINIDSGVIDGSATGVDNNIPYELRVWAETIGKSIPGSPFSGELVTNSPAWTWTETFSYTKAGIPTVDSGLYGSDHTSSYHSNRDTETVNHYSADVFKYAHKLYGGYAILFDNRDAKIFDYRELFDEMLGTIDEDTITQATQLKAALEDAKKAADTYKEKCETVTPADAKAFNTGSNQIFKKVSNELFTLDWAENYQFKHLYKQTNVQLLEAAIKSLEAGDVKTAYDDYLSGIDMNWYAMYFDEATFDYYVNQVLGPNADNSWGTGYLKSCADQWQLIQDLKAKYNAKKPNLTNEIAALKAELVTQKADLTKAVDEEIASLNQIAEMLK